MICLEKYLDQDVGIYFGWVFFICGRTIVSQQVDIDLFLLWPGSGVECVDRQTDRHAEVGCVALPHSGVSKESNLEAQRDPAAVTGLGRCSNNEAAPCRG